MNNDQFEEKKEQAKREIESYLQGKGLPLNKSFRCLNPSHNDSNPSMSYDRERHQVHCFGCGARYDIFDLVGMDHNIEGFMERVRKVFELYGIPWDFLPTGNNYIDQCKSRLADTDYLERRGISRDTALRYGIGYDPACKYFDGKPCLIMPLDDGGFEMRLTNGKKGHKATKGEKSLWNKSTLQGNEPCFITESIIDALSIIEAGGAAMALCSTSGGNNFLREIEKTPPKCPSIVLALDDDPSGRNETERLEVALKEKEVPSYRAPKEMYAGCKDMNDALCKNREQFAVAVISAGKMANADQDMAGDDWGNVVDNFLRDVKSRLYEPIQTGIGAFDKMLDGGLMRQQVVLIGAAPGLGKTAMVQWLMEHMISNTPTASCLFYNFEMSRAQLIARSIARRTGRATNTILQGYRWTGEDAVEIESAAAIYKEKIAGRMIYNPVESVELGRIMADMEQHAARKEGRGLPAPFVVIDYLQLLQHDNWDDVQTIKAAMAAIKGYAVKHDTVVFGIIAHNRAAGKTGAVDMFSGRDSSALEFGADLQLAMTYTECLSEKGKDPADIGLDRARRSIVIVKGRWARQGERMDFEFDGKCMGIKNPSIYRGDNDGVIRRMFNAQPVSGRDLPPAR